MDQGSKTPVVSTNHQVARERLTSELARRGVGAVGVVDSLPDEDLVRVEETIAYCDEQGGGPGLLVKLIRDGFQPPAQASTESDEERAARVRRERHEKDVRWAERNGFTKAQAPFVASARRVLAMLGSEPTAESVRARVKAQHPHLFDESSASREASV